MLNGIVLILVFVELTFRAVKVLNTVPGFKKS